MSGGGCPCLGAPQKGVIDGEKDKEEATCSTLRPDDAKDQKEVKTSPVRRKTHWKSQSVSEVKDPATNFSQNRELWQRRAASQGQIDPPVTPKHDQDAWEMRQKQTPDLVMDLPFVNSPKNGVDKSIAEEDGESSSPGPESPDMTAAERFAKQNQCTLKKNTKVNVQENREASSEVENLTNYLSSEKIIQVKSELELVINPVAHQQRLTPKMPVKFSTGAQVSSKPQIKQKPQILKKPMLPLPLPPNQSSPEVPQKDGQSKL